MCGGCQEMIEAALTITSDEYDSLERYAIRTNEPFVAHCDGDWEKYVYFWRANLLAQRRGIWAESIIDKFWHASLSHLYIKMEFANPYTIEQLHRFTCDKNAELLWTNEKEVYPITPSERLAQGRIARSAQGQFHLVNHSLNNLLAASYNSYVRPESCQQSFKPQFNEAIMGVVRTERVGGKCCVCRGVLEYEPRIPIEEEVSNPSPAAAPGSLDDLSTTRNPTFKYSYWTQLADDQQLYYPPTLRFLQSLELDPENENDELAIDSKKLVEEGQKKWDEISDLWKELFADYGYEKAADKMSRRYIKRRIFDRDAAIHFLRRCERIMIERLNRASKLASTDAAPTSISQEVIDSTVAPRPHDPVILRCGHVFGYDCIVDWLKEHPDCTYCRALCYGPRAIGLPPRGIFWT